MAFVSSFTAVPRAAALRSSAICGTRLSGHVASRAAVTMEYSESVPFLPKPKKCDGLLGSVNFDPLLLSEAIDIRWMQESEIKHGRVCMLAFVGLIVQEFVHLPAEAFSNPLATAAFFDVPTGGLFQIFLFCGICELVGHRGQVTYGDMFDGDNKDRIPGDLGFNPMGIKYSETQRLQEIKVCSDASRSFGPTCLLLSSITAAQRSVLTLVFVPTYFHWYASSPRYLSVTAVYNHRMAGSQWLAWLVLSTRCSSTRYRSSPVSPRACPPSQESKPAGLSPLGRDLRASTVRLRDDPVLEYAFSLRRNLYKKLVILAC